MASTKISALAAILAAAITAVDVLPIVDADAGVPVTNKITMAQMRTSLLQASVGTGWGATDYLGFGAGTVPSTGMVRSGQGAITADSPLINSTATWNNVAITFRHILVNVTDTTSAAGSLFADFQIAGASKWALTKGGAVTQALGLTITAGGLTVSAGTAAVQALTAAAGTFTGVVTITPNLGLTVSGGTDAGLFIGAANTIYLGDYAGATKGLRVNVSTGLATLTNGLTVSAGGVTVTGNSTVTGTLGAITMLGVGTAATANVQLHVGGTFTIPAAFAVSDISTTATATANGNAFMYQIAGGITTAATGTHALVAAQQIVLGLTDGGATVTNYVGLDIVATTTFAHVTTATALRVAAPTGAGTNLAAAFTGNVTMSGTLSGISTLAATTLTGTLSTAAQAGVTSLGTLTSLTTSGTITMTAAASQFIPGATSFSHRNTANSADNLLLTDAGLATFRNTVTISSGGLTVSAGGLTVTGASTITGTLGGITTLTATSMVGALTGNVTGNVSGSSGSTTGNAATATALQTARAINGTNFDGTAAITVTAAAGTLTGATLNATVTASSLTSVGILAAPHMTSPVIDSGGLVITAGDVVMAATAKVRIDGSGSGDTYLVESSANQLDLIAGAAATGNVNVYTGGTIRASFGSGGLVIAANNGLQLGIAENALGGGASATFGTIGGTGPTTAAQNSWQRLLDSAGATIWVPVWK